MEKTLIDTLEGNKLIAKFDGYEIWGNGVLYKNELPTGGHISNLRYYTSWDRQQPIYQKLYKLIKSEVYDNFPAQQYQIARLYDAYPSHYRHGETEKAAQLLAEVIKWHNENHTPSS